MLYFGLGRFYQKRFNAPLKGYSILYPILGLVILVVIIFLGVKAYEYTESPEFCAEACHSMEPYTETYENPGNNTILRAHRDNDVICADCHNGLGFYGTAKTRIEGLGMVFAEYSGNYDPEEFKAEVPNEYCEKSGCHDDVDWRIQAVEGEIFHPYTNEGKNSPKTGEVCINCHNPRLGGTGLAKNSCMVCHDVTAEELAAHEERTCGLTTCHSEKVEGGHRPGRRPKEDACINCHNRLHPDDAKVPYSVVDNYNREGVKINLTVNNEFCSDCHRANYDNFTAVSTGECEDCHVRHKEKVSPHPKPTEESFECHDCHIEIPTKHNPKVVTFKNIYFTLENDFCKNCHTPQYDAYLKHNTGKCIECHSDHAPPEPPHTLPSSAYETCTKCHVGIPDKHDASIVDYEGFPSSAIDNIFCGSCHYSEYSAYISNNPGICTECHEKHKEPLTPHIDDTDYQDCSKCHMHFEEYHDTLLVSYEDFPYGDIKSEFCSTCHKKEYDEYVVESPEEIRTSYGVCANCHNDHKLISYPHRITKPYDDCSLCHTNYDSQRTIHNLTDIQYRNFTQTISNEFCSDCHVDIYDSLNDNTDPDKEHSINNCTDCHSWNRGNLVQYNKCTSCHTFDEPPEHDETLTTCIECHEVDRFIHSIVILEP